MSNLTPDETLLGLIAANRRYGYQLLDCFRKPDQLGRVWKLSTSQIYSVLKRLEREHWLVGHEAASILGPRRIEYRLSEAGQQRMLDWLYEPAPSPSIRRVRVEFLSRLFIARELNLPTSRIVQSQREACHREHERLIQRRGEAVPGIDYLAAEFVIEQLSAVIRWIPRCELVIPDQDNL